MKFLLRLKSWQLFLLFVLPYFLTSVPVVGIVFLLIWTVSYVGWIYAIGTTMYDLLPLEKNKLWINHFKYCCILYGVAIIAIFMLSGLLGSTDFMNKYPIDLFIVLPVSIYIAFSIYMFAARMLESMIEGRIVYRSDALRAFFYIWMFPLGVWYIQPAIRRVLDKYGNNVVKNHT